MRREEREGKEKERGREKERERKKKRKRKRKKKKKKQKTNKKNKNLIILIKILFNKLQSIIKSIQSGNNNINILCFFSHSFDNSSQNHITVQTIGFNVLFFIIFFYYL